MYGNPGWMREELCVPLIQELRFCCGQQHTTAAFHGRPSGPHLLMDNKTLTSKYYP